MRGSARLRSPARARHPAQHRVPRGVATLLAVAAALTASPARAQQPAEEPNPAEDPQPPLEPSAPESSPWSLEGAFTLQLRRRTTSSDRDLDLYGLLRADAHDAEERLEAHLLARAAWDADGDTDHDGAYAFDSLVDTYERRLTGQLYEAWVGGRTQGSRAQWRAGRFFADDIPVPTYVDGARLEASASSRRGLALGAYGGIPSHLYESSPEGDLIAGAFLSDRPWRDGKVRLDYVHIDDEARFADHDDDLLGLSLWQGIGEELDLFGRFTWLELESRDLELRASYARSEQSLRAQVAYYELFQDQTNLSYELDPFYEAALDYVPYRQIQVNAGKVFADRLDLAAGVDVRRLSGSEPDRAFNHEFERWYVTPTLLGFPDEGTTISATWELWDAGSERFATIGSDVSQELDGGLELRAGTAYALYKFDFYSERELERVRSFYGGFDWRATKRLRLRADYTFERDDFDRYSTLRVQASWTF